MNKTIIENKLLLRLLAEILFLQKAIEQACDQLRMGDAIGAELTLRRALIDLQNGKVTP